MPTYVTEGTRSNDAAMQTCTECGFCAAGRALFHCPDCPEFLCAGCDEKIHSHKKHQHHVRKRIPRYDMDGAADRIKDFFRYLIAREILRAKCREVRCTETLLDC